MLYIGIYALFVMIMIFIINKPLEDYINESLVSFSLLIFSPILVTLFFFAFVGLFLKSKLTK
jgi:hypothetical protein